MDNLRGIGLMVLAMVCFTLTDTFIKAASSDLPIGQILVLVGGGGGAIFATLTRAKGHAVIAADFLLWPVILRNISEIIGTVCFVTALSLIDLSTASAILQATPLAVTLGAAVLLREKVQWRRWSAIIVGFIGVMIILRPGQNSFHPETLWAFVGMLGLAMRDLATRMVPPKTPNLRISTYGMSMMVFAGIALSVFGAGPVPMTLTHIVYICCAILLGTLGYGSIVAAMRLGDVSVVAPFRYTRILFALVVGAVVFGERPDIWVLVGGAITICAGLYTFMRERHINKKLNISANLTK